MKYTVISIYVLTMTMIFYCFLHDPVGAQENSKKNGDNKHKQTEQKSKKSSGEEKEIIEQLELLKNLDLFMNSDIDILENLDLFLADS